MQRAHRRRAGARAARRRGRKRYGAPYWVIHRGDLQAVLREAVEATPRHRACSSACASTTSRSTATASPSAVARGMQPIEDARRRADRRRRPLVGAARAARPSATQPRFARPHRLARAGAGGGRAAGVARRRRVNLWLGRNAHLVHYPVRGGSSINWSRSCATTGASPAGARPAIAHEICWRAFRPACGTRRRASSSRAAEQLAEMGAVRLRARCDAGATAR